MLSKLFPAALCFDFLNCEHDNVINNLMKYILIASVLAAASTVVEAQTIALDAKVVTPSRVFVRSESVIGKKALRVVKDSTVQEADEPTYARVNGTDFKNGTIEVKVLSRLLKNAPAFARGFIGVAFRINSQNTAFESIYIRPTNGRVRDQIRRNHSVQYYSYPDYKFDRLRKEAPEKYESYADMGLNEWITLKIVVKGSTAELFLNNNTQPTLIVDDLKLGPDASGGIGLWVETGTEGYFAELKVTKQ